jgi:endonuclease III
MGRESRSQKQDRCRIIIRILKKEFPGAACRLTFQTPFELLIKTILSAQCTDVRVNQVGETLFLKYRKPEDFLDVSLTELETDIYSTGFYRHKAKLIQRCCEVFIQFFSGVIPRTMNELLLLPGVGRKTANVLLATCFHVPGIVVDTHVIRISQLLKLTNQKQADAIEKDLMRVIPEEDWISWSHLISDHGRKTCIARRPRCTLCEIRHHCPFGNKKILLKMY